MAKQTINIGTGETTGDGESIRSAFGKINNNFDEVYSDIATLDGSKIVYGDLSVTTASASGAGSLSYDNTTGVFTFTPAANVAETNDLTSAVTWANIPDAYVPQSAVTQHQAALTITQSQISDLSHFDGAYSSLTGAPTAVSSFTNDSGYITGYTVTESDVTTHQAALSITESQISDLGSYLTAEQHGNFTLSGNSITTSNGDDGIDLVISGATSDQTPAFISKGWRFVNDGSLEFRNPIDFSPVQATVTVAKIGQWDTAYSWGDHSTAGYISGYTVTESDVTAHQAALSITESQISDLGTYVETSGTQSIAGTKTFTDALNVSVTADYSTAVFTSSGHEVNLALDSTSTNGRNYMIVSGGTGGAFIGGRFGVYDADAAAERFGISSTGAIKFNNAFTFPTTDGSNGQVLTTDGSGTLTWQNNVTSNTTGITGADQVTNIVSLTQAEYDAITPNASTVYFIVG